jgi:hypothetical protein
MHPLPSMVHAFSDAHCRHGSFLHDYSHRSIRVYNTAEGVLADTLFSKKYGVSSIVVTHASSCVLYATRKVNAVLIPHAVLRG